MKKLIFTILISCKAMLGLTQIQWLEEADSVDLNPEQITEVANFMVGNEPISGPTNFNLRYKLLFLKDKNGWNRLDAYDIEVINSVFGEFSGKMLFSPNGIEEVRSFYRRKIYSSLRLNRIRISVSRNPKYTVKDEALVMNNEKILDGKICGIEPNLLTIVDVTGKLTSVENRDIAYIDFQNRRFFGVAALYGEFFSVYKEQLARSMINWKSGFIGMSIEKLVDLEGPYDRGIEVNGKRIYTPEKNYQIYDVNLGSRSSTATTSVQSALVNGSSDEHTTGYGDASLYASNNYGSFSSAEQISRSFRGSAYGFGKNFGIAETSSNTYGSVVGRPYKMSLSVKVEDGRIIGVNQENLFAKAYYGMPYRFVNY